MYEPKPCIGCGRSSTHTTHLEVDDQKLAVVCKECATVLYERRDEVAREVSEVIRRPYQVGGN